MLWYWPKLESYIRKSSNLSLTEREDIVQEACIKMYKNLNAYDPSLKFSTWAFQIAHNCMIDAFRKKNTNEQYVQMQAHETLQLFKSSTNIEEEYYLQESMERIRKIVERLPINYREVLVLRFLEEKTLEEIVDIVQKPRGTIASLIQRGRAMLTEQFKKTYIN